MDFLQKVYVRLKCYLGFHDWKYTNVWENKTWERKCTRCGRENEYLSGCGGSEIGCWILKGTLEQQLTVINVLLPAVMLVVMIFLFLCF